MTHINEKFAAAILFGDLTVAEETLEAHPELATTILSHPDIMDSCAAIILASSCGPSTLVEKLIEMGADPETCYEKEGWRPLHVAAMRNQIDVAKVLLGAGAAVDSEDRRRSAPLQWALRARHYDFAELLLQHGANIDCRWRDGYSFLHHEAKDGKNEPLKFMLDHGADPNIRDHRFGAGNTPLHGAALRDRANAAAILLQYGAQANLKNDEGLTPLDMTQLSKKKKVVELLKRHGGKYGTELPE
ncbi:ankyrin repeat domain-containing protein [Chloroflexi bacterium TSY]|nr:ankyrin repeat domain-containing protein [Chloroflexi bacterium TSY]